VKRKLSMSGIIPVLEFSPIVGKMELCVSSAIPNYSKRCDLWLFPWLWQGKSGRARGMIQLCGCSSILETKLFVNSPQSWIKPTFVSKIIRPNRRSLRMCAKLLVTNAGHTSYQKSCKIHAFNHGVISLSSLWYMFSPWPVSSCLPMTAFVLWNYWVWGAEVPHTHTGKAGWNRRYRP
jgi:hypothetical protein